MPEDDWGPDKPPYVCVNCGHSTFEAIGEAKAVMVGGIWHEDEHDDPEDREPTFETDGSSPVVTEWWHTDKYRCTGCGHEGHTLEETVKLREP